MASSTSQLGVARGQPPPDQLAALYVLVDKMAMAGQLGRHARSMELSARASTQAEALFGDDSLVLAQLRFCECESLTSLALKASGVEQQTQLCRAWAILLSLINLLLRRLAANTLLHGTVREEEINYEAHTQAALFKAHNNPVPPQEELRTWASTMGYVSLLSAICRSLDFLQQPHWPTVQKRMVESFVLQGLDIIPQTAGIPANLIVYENNLVAIMEGKMTPRKYGSAFCTAVLRKWRSNAVSSVLRARGVLQSGVVISEQFNAEFEARKRSDIAKHGLRDCALPSCSKTEKTVKEFKLCAGCRSQVYCCLEHQALDWKAHKKACKEKEAERLAEEEAEKKRAGAGAAAA